MGRVLLPRRNAEAAEPIASVVVLLADARMVSVWVLKETKHVIITWIVPAA